LLQLQIIPNNTELSEGDLNGLRVIYGSIPTETPNTNTNTNIAKEDNYCNTADSDRIKKSLFNE